MQNCKLAFIGGGNMARSLIGGLVADGFDPSQIRVSDPVSEVRSQLSGRFGVQTFADNSSAVSDADIVVLAVKPQQVQGVVHELSAEWQSSQLLLSIAAGIRLDDIARWLAIEKAAIVRAMPNTPSLVQAGATALYANDSVSRPQHELAESILRSVGITLWLDDEKQMAAVTAVSGSGPAYYFLVMEAMQKAAEELGLPAKTARLLVLETAFGAAKMALESGDEPAQLRQNVTSPGGTTERAIHELQDGGLEAVFENAMVAAALRARELADKLGQDHE